MMGQCRRPAYLCWQGTWCEGDNEQINGAPEPTNGAPPGDQSCVHTLASVTPSGDYNANHDL